MKWEKSPYGDDEQARCGHLFVRVEIVDHDDNGNPFYNWYVEPDDEDKSYRRAIVFDDTYTFESMDAAKRAAEKACEDLITAMLQSLRDE